MSKYTTELRYVCEALAGLQESVGYNGVASVISGSREQIFNFEYPIFDETYKEVLETKILRHYYTREICEETVGLWKLRLEDRMNTIMPYYNKLYESELLKFNPFYDVDLKRTHSRANDGKETRSETRDESLSEREARIRNEKGTTDSRGSERNSATTERNGESDTTVGQLHWDLYSDTPQGGIAGIEGEGISGTVADNTYLTNARKNTVDDSTNVETSDSENVSGSAENSESVISDVNSNEKYERSGDRRNNDRSENKINNIEQYAEQVVGKMGTGSYSRLLTEFRETFLNIDLMIINELSDLFFGLW